MNKKFESLKSEKFTALNIEQHQNIRGGADTTTGGSGQIKGPDGKTYNWNGDVTRANGKTGYWVKDLGRYLFEQ